jgi:hypothetical protein
MIIQFGPGNQKAYGQWPRDLKVFICRPYFKVVFNNGLGFYILNALKFNVLPEFYATFGKYFVELGFRFLGWTFEVMWSNAYKK